MTKTDVKWLVNKVIGLRIFDDEQGVMNKSVMDIGGEALLFRSLRLWQAIKKGNRPATFTLPNTKSQYHSTSFSAKN